MACGLGIRKSILWSRGVGLISVRVACSFFRKGVHQGSMRCWSNEATEKQQDEAVGQFFRRETGKGVNKLQNVAVLMAVFNCQWSISTILLGVAK